MNLSANNLYNSSLASLDGIIASSPNWSWKQIRNKKTFNKNVFNLLTGHKKIFVQQYDWASVLIAW